MTTLPGSILIENIEVVRRPTDLEWFTKLTQYNLLTNILN